MRTKPGPIVLLEDDVDDQEIIQEILTSLGVKNTVVVFSNGVEALAYLRLTTEQPFIILCDVNLPKMNGLEFREEINNDEQLKRKSIPFIFFSTNANRTTVQKAFELTVQGYFTKSPTLQELEDTLAMIINYWTYCKHPNS